MTPIDDELRDVLRGRAEGVVPLADPMAGIECRAHAMQRRRRRVAVAGSALSVLLVAVVVPVAAPKAQSWRDGDGDGAAGGAGTVQSGAAGPLFREPAAAPSRSGLRRPANYLDWSYAGGRAAPASVVAGGRTHLAAALGVAPGRLVAEELWTGRVPGSGEWLYAVQGWPEGGPEATIAVYRAEPDGTGPAPVYRSPVPFSAPAPEAAAAEQSLPAVRAAAGRVAVVSVPLDARWLLVLPAPEVRLVGYAAPGSTGFARYPAAGAPVLVPRPKGPAPVELVQAVDATGRVLTPPDAAAQRRAKMQGGPVLSGWGLDTP